MNEAEQISLKLTLGEVNQVLEALGTMPYRQVYQLIGKIQRQGESQLEQPESTDSWTQEVQTVSE
ncbi:MULTISPECIES: hypothetical protein [Microcystis]|jgi:hypothetical protein|uniref:Uncharacterized protein n=6 Tax=Microcystis TaxID=1125 RepID=A0A6H9GNN4_MICAE|nr:MULTISPECIES: hypothetical protein [Microcystis]NCR99440.1 hypothetical protein [Microcystis aeruginosa L311-01]OCY12816.1 MAG: hypothetical protein BEV12_08170 [Microcystis aeruginosa CACIAM 03]REJ39565.1 MAG: hypothetical protein DWQ54_22680 [Microcystis flos-aquae TF09]REJ60558.1 MAG: hypothetical protein DWQ56_04955 [Microcystis aeruginosa DA14]TRU07843.1 MAG: hypothetical protein EWV59_17535 [Microcystis aeruginosa Ma_MB_F_20061100_S19D]TRU11397.1 MAG: hypothetical protein EWV58_18640